MFCQRYVCLSVCLSVSHSPLSLSSSFILAVCLPDSACLCLPITVSDCHSVCQSSPNIFLSVLRWFPFCLCLCPVSFCLSIYLTVYLIPSHAHFLSFIQTSYNISSHWASEGERKDTLNFCPFLIFSFINLKLAFERRKMSLCSHEEQMQIEWNFETEDIKTFKFDTFLLNFWSRRKKGGATTLNRTTHAITTRALCYETFIHP